MRRTLLAGFLVLLAAAALAHSKLGTTVPPDGAVLAAMPSEIVLSFTRRLRLTRVRMTRDGEGADLDIGGLKGFATRFAVPVRGRGPGTYRIEWRGLAADGHAMQGGFSFRVE